MGPLQWGDVPTWVAAVFAGGAAWFTYQTIKSQREQIGEQRRFIAEQSENLRLERAALEAAEAERAIAHLAGLELEAALQGQGFNAYGLPAGPLIWQAELRNHTGGPISDVSVSFGNGIEEGTTTRRIRHERVSFDGPVPVLEAGGAVTFRSQPGDDDVLRAGVPRVRFTDARGQRWSLDLNGDFQAI